MPLSKIILTDSLAYNTLLYKTYVQKIKIDKN
jgi:hypothetical protein